MGAFRDATAALARVAALDQENAELRAEIERLRAARDDGRTAKDRDVAQLRAQVDLLKRKLLKAEGREAATAHQRLVERRKEEIEQLEARKKELTSAVEALKDEIDQLKKARVEEQRLREALEGKPPSDDQPFSDNRDAVIARLHEERNDLVRQVNQLRQDLAQAKSNPGWLAKVLEKL